MSVELYKTTSTSTKYFLFGMQTDVIGPTKYFFIGMQTMMFGSTLLIFIEFTNDDATELLMVSIRIPLTSTQLCYQHTNEKTLDANSLSNNQPRVLEILRAVLFRGNFTVRWMRWTKKIIRRLRPALIDYDHILK
jgi:hypothetical protein